MNEVRTLSMLFGIVLSIALFSSPAYGGDEAEAPEWDEGDEWSMGYEIDLGATFGSLLDSYPTFSEEFDSYDSDLEGKAGYYMIFKITEEAETAYTMDIVSGGGVDFEGNVKIKMDMPKEGTYTLDTYNEDFEPPTESKEISIVLALDVSLAVTGTANFAKDGLMLKNLDMEMALKGKMDLKIHNFPETDYDYDDETDEEIMTVEYSNYSVSASADIKLALGMSFDPPLDFFNFPIAEDEEWVAESALTISGTYQGTIDVDGLPEEVMTDLIEENMVFPIVLETLDTGIDEIKDGVINEQVIPVSIPVSCTGTKMVTLADGSSSEAYVIQFGEEEYDDDYDDDDDYYDDDRYYEEDITEAEQYAIGDDSFESGLSEMKFLYCPDERFFVSLQIENMGDELGMDELPGSMGSFELTPMRSDQAERSMGGFQKVGSKGDDPSLLVPILIAIAIIAIIIIIVVIIVILVLRKKKTNNG